MITSADDPAEKRYLAALSDRFDPPTRPRLPRFFLLMLQRRPSLRLVHVGARVARLVEEALTSCGIDSREFAILGLLSWAEGPMGQQAIADRLSRDRTTVMELVTALESKGLVERGPDPADRRVSAVHATRRGLEIFESAEVNLEALEMEIFSVLPVEDERRLFLDLLRMM
jgi:DNA-binding MarR family transcriptional regulator